MFKPLRTTHPAIKLINSSLIDLPAPLNISIWWNYGSLLGLCLAVQTASGLFLSMHYVADTQLAFASIAHIIRDVNIGWLIRSVHANGGSIFFLFLYLHSGRGIYYNSFLIKETWNLGVIILILTIATAFTGYVLPWGQIRFWGATVITRIFSAIPYIGQTLVEWVWGGFAVDTPTLNRFFSFHFILPFLLLGLCGAHIIFLHQTGSNNPVGINSDCDRVPFHPYYSTKDLLGYSIASLLFLALVLYAPNLFTDPENFLNANPLLTPIHIQPEWYFLWLYAILRSIPNKLGGVIALAAALIILFIPPYTWPQIKLPISLYPLTQIIFWLSVSSWLVLTWIGSCPVEPPYILIGQCSTLAFFLFFFIGPLSCLGQDFILRHP